MDIHKNNLNPIRARMAKTPEQSLTTPPFNNVLKKP
jgi:hypothetical protein